MRRHHGYWFNQTDLPKYVKNPLEERYFFNSSIGGIYPQVSGMDWDTFTTTDQYNTVKGTYPIRRIGEYEWTLENWKMEYNPDGVNPYMDVYNMTQLVLDDTNLNELTPRTSVIRDGLYNFADSDDAKITGSILNVINTLISRYPWESDTANLVTRAGFRQLNYNSSTLIFDTDDTKFGYVVTKTASSDTMTISANKQLNITCGRSWTDPQNGQSFVAIDVDNIQMTKETDNDRFQYQVTFSTIYNFLYLVNFNVNSKEELESSEIKIELNSIDNTYYNPNEEDWIEDNTIIGWQIPKKEDFAQLFGMSGILEPSNVFNHILSSDDSEIPYDGDNIGEDILGSRITLSGSRQNVENGLFYGTYNNLASFATYYDATTESANNAPTIKLMPYGVSYIDLGTRYIVSDTGLNFPDNSNSTRYWLRSIRFCRRLTDLELGYKLYVDEVNNRVVIVPHTENSSAVQPDNTIEIPKGILRGLAVRWMDENKTEVLQSLSWLNEEVDKAKNDGEYSWYDLID